MSLAVHAKKSSIAARSASTENPHDDPESGHTVETPG